MNSSQSLNTRPSSSLSFDSLILTSGIKPTLAVLAPGEEEIPAGTPPAQKNNCTVLLPSACSRLSCPGDVCVLLGAPSVLPTVWPPASLIHVNIKHCYSELIFWLDLCGLKDVWVQTNANGKINGITEKGRVKLSNLNHHEEVSSRVGIKMERSTLKEMPKASGRHCLSEQGSVVRHGQERLSTMERNI